MDFIEDYSRGIKTRSWFRDEILHRDEDLPAIIKYNSEDKPVEMYWYQHGEIHRDGDEPAKIKSDNDGSLILKSWYRHGELHRDGDKPSLIHFKKGDGMPNFYWNQNGKLHRDGDEPAVITFNGSLLCQAWYRDGKLHREHGYARRLIECDFIQEEWLVDGKFSRENDLPVSVEYRTNGTRLEAWYGDSAILYGSEDRSPLERSSAEIEVRRSRGDLPTAIGYRQDGSVSFKRWCRNKTLHRENLPAFIKFDRDGTILKEEYYTNGQKVRKVFTAKEIGCVGEVCPISRDVFEENDRVIRLKCNHIFREVEINTWLVDHNTCPFCRSKV